MFIAAAVCASIPGGEGGEGGEGEWGGAEGGRGAAPSRAQCLCSCVTLPLGPLECGTGPNLRHQVWIPGTLSHTVMQDAQHSCFSIF